MFPTLSSSNLLTLLLGIGLNALNIFIFSTFCKHKIVALKTIEYKKKSATLFVLSISPIIIYNIYFYGIKENGNILILHSFAIIAFNLILEHSKKSYKPLFFLLSQGYIWLTFFHTPAFTYPAVVLKLFSITPTFLFAITVMIYEAFIRSPDEELNWSQIP